jgi:hypothetical protein
MPACAGMTVAGWFEIELAGKAAFAFAYAAGQVSDYWLLDNPNQQANNLR